MAEDADDKALNWALRCFAFHMEANEARMALAEAVNPVIELPGSLRLLYTFCDDLMLNVGPLLPMLIFEQNRGEILSNVTPPAHLSEACVRALYEVVFDGSMPSVGSDIAATATETKLPSVCNFSKAQAKFGPFFEALSTLPLAKLRLTLENAPESDCGGYFVNGMAVDMDALEGCIAGRTRFLPFVRRVYALTNATALNQPDRRTVLGEKTANFVKSVSALLKTKPPKPPPRARSSRGFSSADAAPLIAAENVKTAFVALFVALDADFEAGGRPAPAFSSMYSKTAFSEETFSSAMQATSTGFGLFSAFGINEALVLGPAAEHALAIFLEQRSGGLVPVRPLCSSALFEHILSDKEHQKSKIGKYLQKKQRLWKSRIVPKLAKWKVGEQDLVSECLLKYAADFMCHSTMSGPALAALQAQVDIWLGLRTAVGPPLFKHTEDPTLITATASVLDAATIGWGALWTFAFVLVAGLSTVAIAVTGFQKKNDSVGRSSRRLLELMTVIVAISAFAYVIINSNFQTDNDVKPFLGIMPKFVWLNKYLRNLARTSSFIAVRQGAEYVGIALRSNAFTLKALLDLFLVANVCNVLVLFESLTPDSSLEEEKIKTKKVSSQMPNIPLATLLTMLAGDLTPIESGTDWIDFAANSATAIVAGAAGNASAGFGIFTSAFIYAGRWFVQRNLDAKEVVDSIGDLAASVPNMKRNGLQTAFEYDIIREIPTVCAIITSMAFVFSKLAVQYDATRKLGVRLDRLSKTMAVMTTTVYITSRIVLYINGGDFSVSRTIVENEPTFNAGIEATTQQRGMPEIGRFSELPKDASVTTKVDSIKFAVQEVLAGTQAAATAWLTSGQNVYYVFNNTDPSDEFIDHDTPSSAQVFDPENGFISAIGADQDFSHFDEFWLKFVGTQTPKDMIARTGLLTSVLIMSKYVFPVAKWYMKSTLGTSESDEDQEHIFANLKDRVKERITKVAIREKGEDPTEFSKIVTTVIEYGKEVITDIPTMPRRRAAVLISQFEQSSQFVIQRIIDRYDIDSLIVLLQKRCELRGAAYLAECIRVVSEKRNKTFANEPQIVLDVLKGDCQLYYAAMMLVILERILAIDADKSVFQVKDVVKEANDEIRSDKLLKILDGKKRRLDLEKIAIDLFDGNKFEANAVKADTSPTAELRVEGTDMITEVNRLFGGFRPVTLQNAVFFCFVLFRYYRPEESVAKTLKLEDIVCNLHQFFPMYHVSGEGAFNMTVDGETVGPKYFHSQAVCFPTKIPEISSLDYFLVLPSLIFALNYLGNKGERSLRS